LRGPQHHRAWADELASWRYPETWDQLLFGLRLGESPRVVVTTTPKPTALVRALYRNPRTIVTRGSTFDNAQNLAPSALAQLREKYEGTRLGRQELNAEILEESEGALWNREMIERARRGSDGQPLTKAPPMKRIVIAIDPAITAKAESNLTGIIAAGLGEDGRGYVLADSSGKLSPDGWARRAIQQFDLLNADRIIAEGNQGGEMVRHTIHTERKLAPVTIVHARQGKNARAEPIAALYEQGRIGHIGEFKELEDQMCTWEPLGDMPSPDRIDAMVWAFTALMINAPVPAAMGTYSRSGGR
jgi:phage terminase large subunit-like protein